MKTTGTATWTLLLLLTVITASGCAPPARFENEYAPPAVIERSRAAIPHGMRRTKNGWEDATLWSLPRSLEPDSINGWIDKQRNQEPGWVRRAFAEIRETPPWMVAAMQISAIAAIVGIGRRSRTEQPS